ncbi:hypothetical protein SprV_0200564400 [Sparganum proliferum]
MPEIASTSESDAHESDSSSTLPGCASPIHKVDKLPDELLRAKIIQPSSSPWTLPIALVPKKDGSLRLCVDYRRLNAVTVGDSFPLPRLDDTMDALVQAAWFSTLDLKLRYWQVKIHPNDRHKTAFTVPQDLFEFQTLPFGLCNAAATFQRLMYRLLRHLIPYKCLVYLDDIIVFGRSTEEHNSNLREVLEALQEAGLTLNPTKCLFLRSEVQFLGHLIFPGRISPLPDRIKHIRTTSRTNSLTEHTSKLPEGTTNETKNTVEKKATTGNTDNLLKDKDLEQTSTTSVNL